MQLNAGNRAEKYNKQYVSYFHETAAMIYFLVTAAALRPCYISKLPLQRCGHVIFPGCRCKAAAMLYFLVAPAAVTYVVH
jgi:hypothetical protein